MLPQTSLSVLSLTPPTSSSGTLFTTLLPSDSKILNPSTSLAFGFIHGEAEVYTDRISHRELELNEDGSVVATVSDIPRFKDNGMETEVKVYVWKGQKLLGEWEVGRY